MTVPGTARPSLFCVDVMRKWYKGTAKDLPSEWDAKVPLDPGWTAFRVWIFDCFRGDRLVFSSIHCG
jgi:hypothetical protein